ncbi:hypothetical protein [Paeniglutamicibacter kerguelensis]|uniref:hypothetical protein n=1 Tax=Paeniglutamicibacter kerguelensis TaxID=254788 RepID=UPI00360D5481
MKKIVSVFASSALVFATLALAPPAIAAPPAARPQATAPASVAAARAKSPGIAVGAKKTTRTNKPNKSIQTVKLPVLHYSSAKNRKNVAKYANEAVAAELKSFNAGRRGTCRGDATAAFDAWPGRTGIYMGRYASVTMSYSLRQCGAAATSKARSFTVDLKTGKKVSMSAFVSLNDITTKMAVANNFRAAKNTCIRQLDPAASKFPQPVAWDVSTKGIRFHYGKRSIGPAACGIPVVLLPWSEVGTAKEMQGAVKNRTYVNNLTFDKEYDTYWGSVIMTSVQGRKVTVFDSLLNSDGVCLHGVRSGKSAMLSQAGGNNTKFKAGMKDTSANPRFDTDRLGQGWREATASDIKKIKHTVGGSMFTARQACGS